ncbi:hypothetical protein D3C72_2316600 [compost metagenome]
MPVTSVCSFQPPRASGSTASLMAREVSLTLDTAVIAPLRMTTKSASAAYQDEEP